MTRRTPVYPVTGDAAWGVYARMPTVLALSSWTAASMVGLAVMLPVMRHAGIRLFALPTTVLGVRPGMGFPPGGEAISPQALASAFDAVLEHPRAHQLDWAITGYFTHAEQVAAAAERLAKAQRANPALRIAVDPVVGDAPTGLYVPKSVAQAIGDRLIPMADVVLPNAWEAEHFTGRIATSPDQAVHAAQAFERPQVVITSVAEHKRVGALDWEATTAAFHHGPHQEGPHVHGAGDHFTAAYVAFALQSPAPTRPAHAAVALTHVAIAETVASGSPDLIPQSRLPDLSPPQFDTRIVVGPAA